MESDTIWLKLVMHGNQLSGYTSIDGSEFTLFGTHTLDDNMKQAQLQLYATTGFSTNSIPAVFQSVRVVENQDFVVKTDLEALLEKAEALNPSFYETGWNAVETAMVRARRVLNNELVGKDAVDEAVKALREAIESLDDGAVHFHCQLSEEWEILNPSDTNPATFTEDGAVLPLLNGDYPNSQNVLQFSETMSGDWKVTAVIRLNQKLASSWQQTGLALYLDNDNWVKFINVSDMNSNPAVQFNYQKNGTTSGGGDLGTKSFDGSEVWLQLEKQGDQLTGRYSSDGKTYSIFGTHVLDDNMEDARLQLYASGGFKDATDVSATAVLVKLETEDSQAVPMHTVRFDSQDGSAVASVQIADNTVVPEPDAPVRAGFLFGGWFRDEECFSQYDFSNLVTADLTLYAKWTADTQGSGTTSGGSVTSSYTITVTQAAGGRISPSTTTVTKGGDKTFTIAASEGYKIADVLVDGKSVGAVSSYTFENVTARHTITAKFEKVEGTTNVGGFIDVKSTDWFAGAVQYAVDAGLMNGTSSTTFSPKGATTRGMIVTILYRQAGSPEVESDQATWWSDARVWAMANGISDGTNMEKSITREQLATMLYRYAELMGEDVSKTASLDSFKDGGEVSSYAVEALQWAVAEGIVTGKTGGIIDPQAGATRAETATMLMRFCELIK